VASHELKDIPTKIKLDKMSSEEIEAIGADLVAAKNKYIDDYKSKQVVLQENLSKALKKEQDERIAKDPEYWEKHQGIK